MVFTPFFKLQRHPTRLYFMVRSDSRPTSLKTAFAKTEGCCETDAQSHD